MEARRQMCSDGPLSVERDSLRLLTHSLKVAKLEHNKTGGYRPVKRGAHNEARDDVAMALILAAGAWVREYAPVLKKREERALASAA
ncbi:MAG: hypothetical protein OXF51_05990 [Alphaproteobacteria bacterium]|nr:hypothetical protein [Alphaproteobacteria bacterium]